MPKVDKVGTTLRDGIRQQQKRAMRRLFDRVDISLEVRIERVDKEWARPLFRDVDALVGGHGCPQGETL